MNKIVFLLMTAITMSANAQDFVKPKQIMIETITMDGKKTISNYHEQPLPITSELVSYVEKIEFSKDASGNCWATESIETKYKTSNGNFTTNKKVMCPPSE